MPDASSVMDVQQIMQILPHRYPLLLIDRVLEVESRQRIVCLKNISVNEPQFTGHFPEYPLMPGVLMIEAIAQAGGLLLLNDIPDRGDKLMVFTGIDGAKFRKPVIPGDQVRIEVKVLQWRTRAVKMHGTATVDGKLACEATVMCQLVPRPGAQTRAAVLPAETLPIAAQINRKQETGAPGPVRSAEKDSPEADLGSDPLTAADTGVACQPDPLSESNALPEAAV